MDLSVLIDQKFKLELELLVLECIFGNTNQSTQHETRMFIATTRAIKIQLHWLNAQIENFAQQ